MKFLILPFALLLAPMASEAASLTAGALAQQNPPQEELSAKEAAKRAKKARKAHGPEVYKGSVAKERRLLVDAPGAHKEVDPAMVTDEESAMQKENAASGKEKTKIKEKN